MLPKFKIAIWTSFILVLIFLSACQSDTSSSDPKSHDGSKDEQVTLKVWYPGTGQIEKDVQSIIDQFEEEHPNVTIDYEAAPWAEFFQKLTVAYAGGTAPDIHGIGHGQLMTTVSEGQYMDLNEFIDDDWSKDILPSMLEAGQYEGGQYGLIWPGARPLVWRKDYFEEAGLDPERPPETLDELFEYARKLAIIDEKGTTKRAGIDIQTGNGEQSYFSLLVLAGEGLDIYDETGNPQFDSEESISLVKEMVSLYDDGAIISSHQQQIEGSLFSNGLAAMTMTSSNQITSLIDAIGEENLGWSLPPKGPTGSQTAMMLGDFISMNKNTAHPEEAWEFMKFWYSPEIMSQFTEATGYGVARASLQEEFSKKAPQNEVVFEAMQDARGYSPTEYWSENMEYLRLALEEAFNGIRPVEEALKVNAENLRKELGIE